VNGISSREAEIGSQIEVGVCGLRARAAVDPPPPPVAILAGVHFPKVNGVNRGRGDAQAFTMAALEANEVREEALCVK
jgi:hypothetical protein